MKMLSFLVIMILVSIDVYSQNIEYTNLPSQYQLYPRDGQDSAQVLISGTVITTGYDSIILEIYRNSSLWNGIPKLLSYLGGQASFSFSPKIYAELAEYDFSVILKQNPTTETTDITITNVVCGDAYLINGQSNAVGSQGSGGDKRHNYVRSFGNSTNNASAAQDSTWDLASKTDYGFHEIGVWGLRLGRSIADSNQIPVCIIQQGQGSQDITYFTDGIGAGIDLDKNYDRLLYRSQNAGVVDNVKAIFWWQGEDDATTQTNVDNYESRFRTLYNAWKSDYANLSKVYTTQIHPGYGDYADQLREIQRKIATDSSDIEIITPHNMGGFDGAHHNSQGYQNYGDRLYRLMARDFYGGTDTVDIDPPDIQNAYFIDSNKNVLVLEFDNQQPLTSMEDTLKDHFYFHYAGGSADTCIVQSISVFTNKVRLQLTKSANASEVTYLPARYYNGTTVTYDGPWIINSKDMAVLSFYQFPIDTGFGDDPLPVTLSIFSAKFKDGVIKLRWRTKSEVNNLGFILLRKDSSQQKYKQISSYEYDPALEGRGTTSKATDYEFIDSNIISGETYTYLLIDVDYSGNKTLHGPLTFTATEGTQPQGHNLYQNYSNPFNPSTNIAFFLPQQHVLLRAFDILGQEVEVRLDNQIRAGYHEISFNASNLQSGYYFYEIRTADYDAVRKMLLIR